VATMEVIKQKFDPKDGPFFQCLSTALDKLHVHRQAYQGGTFVGNHVNKLLKVCNVILTHFKHITQSYYRILVSRSSCPPSNLWQRRRVNLPRLRVHAALCKLHSATLGSVIEATVEVQ